MQNNNSRVPCTTQTAAGRGRWYNYRSRKNQRRNEQPSASPSGSVAVNGPQFIPFLGSNSNPIARQFPHPPSASTAAFPSQYPQRTPAANTQVLTQRQSQRGRSQTTNYTYNTNKQKARRHNKQETRKSKGYEAASASETGGGTSSIHKMETQDDEGAEEQEVSGHPDSPTPLSLVGLAVRGPSVEESDIPGFAYDPNTRKYFKIQSDASGGAIGFRRSDFARERRQREHELSANQLDSSHKKPRHSASSSLPHVQYPGSTVARTYSTPHVQYPAYYRLPDLLCARELGYRSSIVTSRLKNGLAESALRNARAKPNFTREVLPNHVDRLAGCQYLDVSNDGKTIVGCWAVSNWGLPGESERTSSRIMCLDVSRDENIVRWNGLRSDGLKSASSDSKEDGNKFGLKFKATSNSIYVLDPCLVDMVTAPVDSDVTCVLYATARSHMTSQYKVATCCRVFLEPVPELSNEEGADEMSSPIYNIRWTCQEEMWSCAWNANKMRIGLGMESNAMMIDVVSEQNFRISSKRKNVLSQQFSQDGDLLYMGRRGADMVCSDLRLKTRHMVGTFEGSHSVGWIKLLKSQPNLLLSENFAGELKMWDIRSRKTLMSFEGHKNSHYRLPCFVDDNERFVFAVGEDGTSRGWSLRSGDLLCAVPSPRPIEQRTDFPRLVYSDNWAGIAGNSALVVAVEGDIRIHELTL